MELFDCEERMKLQNLFIQFSNYKSNNSLNYEPDFSINALAFAAASVPGYVS